MDKKSKMIIIAMAVVILVMFFGFIMPEVPLHKRIKREDAEKLRDEMKALHLNKGDGKRYHQIRSKLISAGYYPTFEVKEGSLWSSLGIPSYAQ